MSLKTAIRLLYPAFAVLLLPAAFRCLTAGEAAAEELYSMTAAEALLQALPPLTFSLLLIAQGFIPAMQRLYVALCRSALHLKGRSTAEKRARLLGAYLAWLGLSAGVFLLMATPSLFDDVYCPELGIAGDFWGTMTCAILGMHLLLLSLLAASARLAIRWWQARRLNTPENQTQKST